MANIKIVVEGALMDGHEVSFKAPCDCTAITGLNVQYVEDMEIKNRVFTLKDAHGNDLTGIGNLFQEGAIVKVLLDTVNSSAYIQNADTNAYLEGRLGDVDTIKIVDALPSDAADHPNILYLVKEG